MLNKKVIAGIATASIVVSCGFVGSFAFADEVPANNPVTTPAGYHDEVPNNPPKPNPVTTPTVKPEDDIYGSGSEWDQLQNAENEYENYYDQKYNTHNNYNGGHGTINFDPNWFNTDPNGNDTKPEIPDEHKNPQTPPAPQPKVDTTKEDAEFKSAQDSANQKAKNALLLKQIAEGSVKALQAKVDKATGAEKTKLQEQLENAQKIANSLDELNNKANSMVKAYTQAATIRGEVKTLEGQVATAQAKFDALAKQQTGPAGSPEYNKAAEELGKLQKQLKSKKNLLEKANKGVTKAEETLVKQETKTQEVQNPKKEEPKAPEFNVHDALAHVDGDKVADYKLTPADVSELVGEKKNTDPVVPPAPKPVTPTPKPVNPVEPDHTTPSNPSTPSDDTPSSTPSVTTPSASTPAGASQSAPAAGVPAAPASVADLLPALKGMITAGANNVVVAGVVNRVTLSISNQAFLDRLNRDGSAKAYAFIYSSPRLLKGADGANYVTVRLVNGKPQFDAMFPAGYSGKHTVVLVDEQGNQLGWTNITVKSGVSGLPNSGVGVALTALAASVLAGAGAAFRKIRR
ncbi:hypothetical protein [Gardnerella pickettii]|uniref:LPXTG-motif protein cell wall anchor domain protein n=1 Tax=Gardnerella pickettii JCP8017A TaxID=1261062 RepID=T2PJI7_9BIFI|nr:hypothetical protein [Gardnerella pickettii]EPI51450.1 hypothetical protein HMPREF1577_01085 [Gardnerella pickettii JCP8017A]EPI60028.1 hypothetical protein HMPREF1578_01206 [Gardnerella pickettii JCP8017B]